MEVTLIDLPPTRLACLRHVGPYGSEIGSFWAETFYPWLRSHGLAGKVLYGIGRDDPSVTPSQQCRYDACVEVGEDFVADGDSFIETLPGGRYAAADFQGTPEEIGAAWMELLRHWLPASGMRCNGLPCFERYIANGGVDAKTGTFSCQLCIPVQMQ